MYTTSPQKVSCTRVRRGGGLRWKHLSSSMRKKLLNSCRCQLSIQKRKRKKIPPHAQGWVSGREVRMEVSASLEGLGVEQVSTTRFVMSRSRPPSDKAETRKTLERGQTRSLRPSRSNGEDDDDSTHSHTPTHSHTHTVTSSTRHARHGMKNMTAPMYIVRARGPGKAPRRGRLYKLNRPTGRE